MLIEFHYTFSISYIVLTFMFIIIVFDRVSTRSSPVSLRDFYFSLARDSTLLIKSVLHFAFLHLLSGYYYYER